MGVLRRDPGDVAGADADRPRDSARAADDGAVDQRGGSVEAGADRRSAEGARRSRGEPGVARLREILDRRTFRYTRTELERVFIPLAREAGLPLPRTSVYVTGHEVDFHFDELGLVVETDGLTYHRTPAQQAKDRVRDQDHSAAGLTQLRFTHEQIKYEPERVVRILRATVSWLGAPASP